MPKKYTDEHDLWICQHARDDWRTSQEFVDAFNDKFNMTVTLSSITTHMQRFDMPYIKADDKKYDRFTKAQKQWIRDNANVMVYRNHRHFTELFNAIHGTNIDAKSMTRRLSDMKISVTTENTIPHYSDEQKKWLIDNYARFDGDFVALAKEYNETFGEGKSNVALAKYCGRQLKIHTPKAKKECVNKGRFKKGSTTTATTNQLPVGSIRMYTSNTCRMLYIKVKLASGDSGELAGRGHNFKRPWWIPLKEKVWTDAYGEIPEGYSVINLDKNPENCDLSNLALADKRGLAIMGSHKWWTENGKFNATAIQWCNLYMTAKDNSVVR